MENGLFTNRIFILAVAIIVIVAVAFVVFFYGKGTQRIIGEISAVSLNSNYSTTHSLSYRGSYSGFDYSAGASEIYSLNITNSESQPITISRFSTSVAGFVVSSSSPTLPITLTPGETLSFTLTITTPTSSYNGTLTLVYDYIYGSYSSVIRDLNAFDITNSTGHFAYNQSGFFIKTNAGMKVQLTRSSYIYNDSAVSIIVSNDTYVLVLKSTDTFYMIMPQSFAVQNSAGTIDASPGFYLENESGTLFGAENSSLFLMMNNSFYKLNSSGFYEINTSTEEYRYISPSVSFASVNNGAVTMSTSSVYLFVNSTDLLRETTSDFLIMTPNEILYRIRGADNITMNDTGVFDSSPGGLIKALGTSASVLIGGINNIVNASGTYLFNETGRYKFI